MIIKVLYLDDKQETFLDASDFEFIYLDNLVEISSKNGVMFVRRNVSQVFISLIS